jgi:hypothetical protein
MVDLVEEFRNGFAELLLGIGPARRPLNRLARGKQFRGGRHESGIGRSFVATANYVDLCHQRSAAA